MNGSSEGPQSSNSVVSPIDCSVDELSNFLQSKGVEFEIIPNSISGLGNPVIPIQWANPSQVVQLVVCNVESVYVQAMVAMDAMVDHHKLIHNSKYALSGISRAEQHGWADTQGLAREPALPFEGCLFVLDKALVKRGDLFIRVHEKSCLIKLNAASLAKLASQVDVDDISIPLESLNEDWQSVDDELDVQTSISQFTDRRIQARLSDTLELPPLPAIAQQIIELRMDENAGVEELVQIIEKDPSLAAQVVSWASSPFYGAGEISSVQQAVVRVLGYDVVLNMALGLALTKDFAMPTEGPFGAYSYWEEVIWQANITEALAQLLKKTGYGVDVGLAYLSGLLANFGTFILAQVFPPYYEKICRAMEVNPHVPDYYIDRHMIGTSRHALSAQLFKSWNLPSTLVNVVRWQHHPEYLGDDYTIANLVYVGTHLLRSQGLIERHSAPILVSMIDDLGLCLQDINDLLVRLNDARGDVRAMIEMFQ